MKKAVLFVTSVALIAGAGVASASNTEEEQRLLSQLHLACPNASNLRIDDDSIRFRSSGAELAATKKCLRNALTRYDPWPINQSDVKTATRVEMKDGMIVLY